MLDEPTSQLDPKSAEDVLNALVRLNSDLGLTVILAEHRLERVLPFADACSICPMPAVAKCRPVILDDPRTVLLQIDLVPPLVPVGKALGWSPLPLTIKEGLRFSRPWLADHRKLADAPPRHRRLIARSGAPYVEARGVQVRYGRQEVLHGVDLVAVARRDCGGDGAQRCGQEHAAQALVGAWCVRKRGSIRW